jgi:DNA-binding NarL/FixJ family response regulator
MGTRTTVYVVDDHQLVRQGIVQLIKLEDDLEVVGEGTGSAETIGALRRLQPDVALVDLEMPEVRGSDFIGQLKGASGKTRVLVCTMHASYAYVAEALAAGADGYVLKSSPSSFLVEGIRRVAAGQGQIDPALQSDVIKLLQSPEHRLIASELTPQEIDAVRLAADGLSNPEIARRTGQSVETVKLRLRRSFQKLGASDRASAVALALRRNLIH